MAFQCSEGQGFKALREMFVFSLSPGKGTSPWSRGDNEATCREAETKEGLPPFVQEAWKPETHRHLGAIRPSTSLQPLSIPAIGWAGKIYSSSQELLSAEFRNLWPEPPTLRVKDRASKS